MLDIRKSVNKREEAEEKERDEDATKDWWGRER